MPPSKATALTTRPVQSEDLPSLARVLHGLPIFQRYGLRDAAELVARWEVAMTQGEIMWMAEAAATKAPIGIARFMPVGAFGIGAYLRTLAVVDDWQGGGVGSQLLATFEHETRDGRGGWFILASDFNRGAHRFYDRHGYRAVGRMNGLVMPAISEVLFWKPRRETISANPPPSPG